MEILIPIVPSEDIYIPNEKLADHLKEIGALYIVEGDKYRAKTFNDAASKIELYPDELISGQETKEKIGRGIGDSTVEVIDEFLSTGTSTRLISLQEKNAIRIETLKLFMSLHGVGPVTANKFYDAGFRTLDELWYKANLTSAQKLSIYYREHLKLRIPRDEMVWVDKYLHLTFPGMQIIIAGSYRREEPDSGDIDVLIKQLPGTDLSHIVSRLKEEKMLVGDLAQGSSKYLGLLQVPTRPVRRIDLLIISPESWGSALLYFTGSQRFNILMRQRAKDLNLRLNEYGLSYLVRNAEGVEVSEKIRTETEEDVFRILRLKYLEPKDRVRDLVSLEVSQ